LNFEQLLTHVTSEKWKAMPKETVMGHIHLHVSELKKTEAFYVNGLGFEVVNRFGRQALFLSSGKYHHHIGVNTWNGEGAPPPPTNSVGLEHFTLVFGSDEELMKVVTNIKELGADVTEVNGMYITFDPSGIKIVLSI
ncbi:glyoxalase, partial [Virgibacillus halodenitrificans]|nr:glyoxalase [Virgibacillus halodenitrificans]